MASLASQRALSDTEIISYEPATGAELWRGPVGDVDETVMRARRAWPQWAAQPLATRIELMRRFANEVRKEQDKFAELIAKETGKPLWEARGEVESVVAKVEISVRAYAERTGQRKLDSALQGTAAVRHKPHGVMAVLGPFNFPAHLPNGHIIPALIAGNVVVFKPSEKTPAVGEFLLQCFNKAGISAAVVQLLVGGPEEGKALVAHDGIDGVLFTGSAQAGIAINRKLAANPGKIVALEMGGNNPLVVWDTPKITDAAVLIVQSAFTSAGQRCTAARRLIVKSSLYDATVAEVKRLVGRIIVGAPFEEPAPFIASMLAAGLDRNAMRWGSAVDEGSEGWALLALAQPDRSGTVSSGAVDNFADDDASAGKRKAGFLIAGLAGLGRMDEDAARSAASDLGFSLTRQSPWTAAIDRAGEYRNQPLVALLAGLGMQGSGWDKMTPRQLFHIVRALNRAGLSAEARMIAAEAVARG